VVLEQTEPAHARDRAFPAPAPSRLPARPLRVPCPSIAQIKMQEQAEHSMYNGTKPLCVFCGHCSYHGYCASGYFAQPGYEDCRAINTCTRVTYAAEILAHHQQTISGLGGPSHGLGVGP
jgi:formylmethanofuran dehydrogenase subunit B